MFRAIFPRVMWVGGVEGVNGPMLQLINNDPDTNDTALSLVVEDGEPPMRVSSAAKVVKLNSDELDNRDSSAFLPSEIYEKFETETLSAGSVDNRITHYCDQGDVAVSGTYRFLQPGTYLKVFGEERVDDRFEAETEETNPSGWHVYVDNPDEANGGLHYTRVPREETMTIIRKTFRIARGTALVLGMAMMLALALGVASVALAAVPGDPFRLGQVNVIDALTQLVGEKTGPMLRIDNNGPGYALQLLVEPNRAPLVVNADSGKAVNLNADELDGKDSGEFVQNAGEMTFSVFDSWMSSHSPSDPVTVDDRGYWTTFTREAGGQTQSEVRLAPPLPSSLYGKSMLLTGMEICYDTSDPAVALSRVKLLRYSSSNGGGRNLRCRGQHSYRRQPVPHVQRDAAADGDEQLRVPGDACQLERDDDTDNVLHPAHHVLPGAVQHRRGAAVGTRGNDGGSEEHPAATRRVDRCSRFFGEACEVTYGREA